MRNVFAVLVAAVTLSGCSTMVAGTPTWPGETLEKVLLTKADFPAGVRYDRITEEPGQPDGAGGPPSMLSKPEGCSNGLTDVIAESAERGPGSAAKYAVAYDGARMVVTVLSWQLDLDKLAATAARCETFKTYFDPTSPGIPIVTTKLPSGDGELVYQQTMTIGGQENSIYMSFTNIGSMGMFGIALPSENPTIPVKGSLPQTFLDTVTKQADRIRSS
ncbi:MAG: hypothetical protein ABWY93_09500 [Mycobacterium sp.]